MARRDGQFGAPAQALGPLRGTAPATTPRSVSAGAARICSGSRPTTRLSSQRTPAALVIDQVGDIFGQHELPAVRGGHRARRAGRLLEFVEQHRQVPHQASVTGPAPVSVTYAPAVRHGHRHARGDDPGLGGATAPACTRPSPGARPTSCCTAGTSRTPGCRASTSGTGRRSRPHCAAGSGTCRATTRCAGIRRPRGSTGSSSAPCRIRSTRAACMSPAWTRHSRCSSRATAARPRWSGSTVISPPRAGRRWSSSISRSAVSTTTWMTRPRCSS